MVDKEKSRTIKNKMWLVCLSLLSLTSGACLGGCSNGSKMVGTYYGNSSGGIFTFKEDGTCTYEEEYRSKVASFNGTWTYSDKDNTCEIVLNGTSGTLYGSISEAGDITITSDSDFWTTEIFSKEQ